MEKAGARVLGAEGRGRGSGEWVFSLLEIVRWYRSSHARVVSRDVDGERERESRTGASPDDRWRFSCKIIHTRDRKFRKIFLITTANKNTVSALEDTHYMDAYLTSGRVADVEHS
jgi:hypothetical protein